MCGEIFDDNLSYYEPMPAQQVHSLDYSMQLQQGLNNFYVWRKAAFPNIADSHVESFHVPGKRMDPQLAAKAKVMSGDINHNHSQSSWLIENFLKIKNICWINLFKKKHYL